MSKEERFKIFIAVYLVLEKNNKILLLKRANTGYEDGNYSLVSGHLDGGETIKQSMIREAKEEAGIILKEEDLKVVHVLHRNGVDREYIDVYLRAQKFEGEVKNMEPEKCDDLSWFDKNKLPNNIIDSVKNAFKNIEEGIFYGEWGWK